MQHDNQYLHMNVLPYSPKYTVFGEMALPISKTFQNSSYIVTENVSPN
jgi:hypothetical protein